MIKKGTNIRKAAIVSRLRFDEELKQINFLDTRLYQRSQDIFYPSVTTILQYAPKDKHFERYLKRVGYNADYIVSQASSEGAQVHNAIDKLLQGEQLNWIKDNNEALYSEDIWKMICRFYNFWTRFNPDLIASEIFTYSDKYKYAGTLDLLVELDSKIWLLDNKTSNYVSSVYSMQLAAYKKAIEETQDIQIDNVGVLWLKSNKRKPSTLKGVYQGEGWEIIPVDNIDYHFELFMCAHKFYYDKNPDPKPLYRTYPTQLKL